MTFIISKLYLLFLLTLIKNTTLPTAPDPCEISFLPLPRSEKIKEKKIPQAGRQATLCIAKIISVKIKTTVNIILIQIDVLMLFNKVYFCRNFIKLWLIQNIFGVFRLLEV